MIRSSLSKFHSLLLSSPLRWVLEGMSWGYRLVIFLRRWLYDWGIFKSYSFSAKIISVGNLTVGGTGKTPFVIYLAQKYQQEGKRVVTISRGYKAEKSEVVVVSDGQMVDIDWRTCGDEPYLIAYKTTDIPVLACRNRAKACQYAIDHFQAEIIILDDAFQHWRVRRDADYVLLDATNPFANEHLLPRGLLREPPSALQRATHVVLTRTAHIEKINPLYQKITAINPNIPISKTDHQPTRVRRNQEIIPLENLAGRRLTALCSIGNPAAFHHTLRKLGVELIAVRNFPDHHPYQQADIDHLENTIPAESEGIITTEKDWVRLVNLAGTEDFLVLEIELIINQ